jgi:hypothetical protein
MANVQLDRRTASQRRGQGSPQTILFFKVKILNYDGNEAAI